MEREFRRREFARVFMIAELYLVVLPFTLWTSVSRINQFVPSAWGSTPGRSYTR